MYPGKGVTHDCASILDTIAKGTSCFHYILHGASLHPHSFIITLVKYIYTPSDRCCTTYMCSDHLSLLDKEVKVEEERGAGPELDGDIKLNRRC